MDWKNEWKPVAVIITAFLALFFMPIGTASFNNAVLESLHLLKWYAREHVILCLVPAFFIAGAISVFISQNSVIRYLGSKANKALAYGVASVSGAILAVCSCTILPLFAGIYRMGAGLGPAVAFLYSGPAINVLAIILTARILGLELGIARAVGAVVFSVVIGLIMELLFRSEDEEGIQAQVLDEEPRRSLVKNAFFFAVMVAILVFANWGKPPAETGLWAFIYGQKWIVTGLFWIVFSVILIAWFEIKWWKIGIVMLISIILGIAFPGNPLIAFSAAVVGLSILLTVTPGEAEDWFTASWGLAKQILPLLLAGVLVSGVLLGRPGEEGIIPSAWITAALGGNSVSANLFASFAGALMYFATLTEVPILQGLLGNGMGQGPALALLLAGPALSLPNMLVIRSVMGTKKTLVFVALVVVMATICGIIFGSFIS